MQLVLFGATGNVGRRIAAEALRRGHAVVGVVRDPAAVESPDPRVRLVQGDATNADSVAQVVRGADAVVSAISPRPILGASPTSPTSKRGSDPTTPPGSAPSSRSATRSRSSRRGCAPASVSREARGERRQRRGRRAASRIAAWAGCGIA